MLRLDRPARAVLLALLLAAAARPAPAAALPVDPAFAADAIWDDGLAEVSTYDAERVIYGKPRPHEARILVVKEEFSDAEHVKADPPYAGRALTTVLKSNWVATIETENYPYHVLASIFVRRADVTSLVKATVGSQEWCGNTFKEVLTWAGEPRLHVHSYFEGQGDAERPLPLGAGGLLEEQIPLAVRGAALPEGGRVALRVADSILGNQAAPVIVRDASLLAGPIEEVRLPSGSVRARRFDLSRGDDRISYWVAVTPDRALVRMEASDGRRLLLRDRRRRDYWSR